MAILSDHLGPLHHYVQIFSLVLFWSWGDTGAAQTTAPGTYNVDISATPLSPNELEINMHLDLPPGSFTYSPLTCDPLLGHVRLELQENPHLTLGADSAYRESPASIAEMDPVLNQWVRVIRQPVIVSRTYQLSAPGEAFKTTGGVFFVLEPACTPIDIQFILAGNKAGDFEVQKLTSR